MPVRIRLARHGQKHTPYYHIVAIASSKRRNAQPIEKLGEFDPIPRHPAPSTSLQAAISSSPIASLLSRQSVPSSSSAAVVAPGLQKKEKKIVWDVDRIRWWLGNGAQPTDSVVRLFERGGILTGNHKWRLHQKASPKTKTEGSE